MAASTGPPLLRTAYSSSFALGQGKYKEAGELYERAIGIWEEALGTKDPNVATGRCNLAGLLQSQVKVLRHISVVILCLHGYSLAF